MKCIGFGKLEGKCANEVDKRVNPVWCPDCNTKRIEHISGQMQNMLGGRNTK